ncbi:MAG: 3-hydroxyisobutyrate dehydrogenase [Solirubrobacteraceae bacterium]|nr:3-hydroxyisobutyrate dehydrogenase [Solirubrobacteraceae bacterium]
MGAPMAGHLLAAGHDVAVFNRTRSRADGLVADGARWCETPAAVADGAEAVVAMVGYPADVRATVLEGALPAMADGTLLIDMTTSEPSLAVEVAQAAAAREVDALDAPVSGGDVGARNATLVIMAGGSEAAFKRAAPIFEILGSKAAHCGGAGSGQHTKMANQITIASGMVGVCEALLYAHRAGLDLDATIDTIGGGAAGSWSLSNLAPRVAHGDLEPGFKIDHFVKDLGIALAEARRMTLPLPGLALAEALYQGARAQDLGQKGTQALLPVLANLAGIDWNTDKGDT